MLVIENTREYGFGMLGESAIALWLRRSRGRAVLPVYELQMDTDKGPRFFAADGKSYVAPDMLAISTMEGKEPIIWVEAKRKTVFSWYRIGERWVTGIDLRHYEEYLSVVDQVPWPLWLLFLHESGEPTEHDRAYQCPRTCPTGLFGKDVRKLSQCESHRSPRHGSGGMVYWGYHDLDTLAELDEIHKLMRERAAQPK